MSLGGTLALSLGNPCSLMAEPYGTQQDEEERADRVPVGAGAAITATHRSVKLELTAEQVTFVKVPPLRRRPER